MCTFQSPSGFDILPELDRYLYRWLKVWVISALAILVSSAAWSDPVTECPGCSRFGFETLPVPGTNAVLETHGGQLVSDGVSGSALRLGVSEELVLDGTQVISGLEGSISFWVRTRWSSGDAGSHTLMSFTWGGGGGYFVVSSGWWEPSGATQTYYVYNNSIASVNRLVRFKAERWTHIAVTWSAGSQGKMVLYVDGFPAVSKTFTPIASATSPASVYIGSDTGSSLRAGRWAQADFDELGFYPYALSEEQVFDQYDQYKRTVQTRRSAPSPERRVIRAIFDEGNGWVSEARAIETLDRIKAAGFNVYVPCVWHGSGTRYPSSVAPPETWLVASPDPLARLITLAKARGIEVHPWITVALRQRDFLTDYWDAGTPASAFDMHRPDFRRFMIDLVSDLVQRYDVQGVNLDFIRTMGTCTSASCQQEYSSQYGRDLLADKATSPMPTPLRDWHGAAVREVVAGVRNAVSTIRPGAIITVDGVASPYQSQEGRNEVDWLSAGLIDYAFAMDYKLIPDMETIEWVKWLVPRPDQFILLAGNYDWNGSVNIPRTGSVMSSLVSYAQDRWGGDIGVYIYSLLTDDQISALSGTLSSSPFVLPGPTRLQIVP